MDRVGPDTTVFVILGAMAVAALLSVFALVVVSVRRREAKPILAVLAFAGVFGIGLLVLAVAGDGGALDAWLARYPHHTRAVILASISAATRWFWFIAGCGLVITLLASIGAALAMLPGLEAGRAQRLAMLFPGGYRYLAERWGEFRYGVRVRLWLGLVLLYAGLAWLIVIGLDLLAGRKAPQAWSFWGFLPTYVIMSLFNLQSWYYERKARRLERQLPRDGAGQAASE